MFYARPKIGGKLTNLSDRLPNLFIPEPNSGCWLWIGKISWKGYGNINVKIDGVWKTKRAHRVCYETFVGPIPDGMDIDHKCRVRCCVNPDHLEPVSRSENLSRSPLMNRQGHKICCPIGHPYDTTNSRGKRICRRCLADTQRRFYYKSQGASK